MKSSVLNDVPSVSLSPRSNLRRIAVMTAISAGNNFAMDDETFGNGGLGMAGQIDSDLIHMVVAELTSITKLLLAQRAYGPLPSLSNLKFIDLNLDILTI